ncbi:NfeD family protein [Schlesneria sp. T3-172]|uniref:NfeD family protein n=1 Tax=Schlesneria sphaerica TaxID=3373610 RepID=UPI0037CA3BAE
MKCQSKPDTVRDIVLASLFSIILFAPVRGADGQEEPVARTRVPLGQFVTVTSPVDDIVYSRISSAALRLQQQATQEDRPAVLVLQIEPGTSQFHHIQGLSKFLTSSQVANVTTVAWIPATITGPNVLLALACKQIVMHPDAELGDIGRGKPLEAEEQQAILAMAQKRHNSKINAAIVRGMMDPQEQLWRVRVRSMAAGTDELETRVVTKDELETLRRTNVTIENVEIVKDPGSVGLFRGSTARSLDILVSQTAENRTSVATLYGLQRDSLRETAFEKENRKARLIKVDGIIDRLQESFLIRQISSAVADGAQVIVFEIDSPGGLLVASITLANAIADLESNKVRTIAYVPREAISGAAIIALGCDDIYLRPDAKIGDAGPIEMRPGQPFERAPEKILSPLKVALRELAEKKHRPAAICEAMADRTMKVYQVTHRDSGQIWYMSELDIHASNGEWIQGPLLRETNGELLFTANGTRAHELKLAESPVSDVDDLKARIGLPVSTKLVPIAKTWVDRLVFSLNHPGMVMLMIVLGVALIYLELHFMTGILGIMSVLCFSLFFWSNFMGGTAGWLEVVLFVLGLGCLAVEAFVIPGFGVFGVSGILLVICSLVMAGHSWTFDFMTNIEELTWQTGQIMLAFGIVFAIGLAITRYLPSMPGFDSLVLGPPGGGADEPRLRGASLAGTVGSGVSIEIGDKGHALTMLRPAGKAQIENRSVDVISEGPFIAPDANLEVVSISGNRIVVRQVPERA